MQFTTLALSALSIGSALAQSSQVMVHVVKVGNANGTLAYSPNEVTAAVGDMVQFQFAPANHTVTQSTFDQPCQPISLNSNTTGIFSGFMPVSASATTTPTYTILVNSTTPMWLYCSQGKHCQSGMTMVINVNPTANSTRTLANFQALAAKATANLAPGSAATNGTSSTASTSSTNTSSSSSSSTSSSTTASTTASGALSSYRVPEALTMAGLLALGMALFV